jgi:transposase InsO family protein
MAYSTNPNLPGARATALRMHIVEGIPLGVAARKCGIHRSTLWRWKQKWDTLNEHVQLTNDNRPTRSGDSTFRQAALKWLIPTLSSRPHTSPKAVSREIVVRILELRETLKRCAEVVWYHLSTIEGVSVSLSSVRRILRHHHCFDGARKPRLRRDNPRRPRVTKPGELVETDTIHHVDPFSGKRLYYYTVIDPYTRMTHTMLSTRLGAGLAARAVLEARETLGFSFAMVQSDNGPEYSRFFEQTIQRAGISTRHSRLHRPNDNAHIERFNRTLQEECIGHYWRRSVPLRRQRATLDAYLDYYNNDRVHLGIQMKTPAEMLQRS